MKEKYPKSYLKGCDENYEIAREGFNKIKEILIQKRQEMEGNQEEGIEKLVTEIWEKEGLNLDQIMNKKQCQRFLTDFIKHFNVAMTDEAFDQIFEVLDTNMDK